MYRTAFIGFMVTLIAASILFGWALSKEIEAFTDMEDYDA